MNSADVLVYDMANASTENPSIFVKKDWLAINDSNSQNYAGNQFVLETSALSNSSRYINYREGSLHIPLLLTLTGATATDSGFKPATAATSAAYAVGLKNAFHTIIDNLTLDLNGRTIIQVSRYLPVYNNFKLLTTLSDSDVKTLGTSIGFAKDNALSVSFQSGASTNGLGASNNENFLAFPSVTGAFNSYEIANSGLVKRQQMINYDPDGVTSSAANAVAFSTLLSAVNCNQLYKSYIFKKQNAASSGSLQGIQQTAIMAVCPLKFLASFFQEVPLVKGMFMKITAGISNCDVTTAISSNAYGTPTINNALGGVMPIMLASALPNNGAKSLVDDTYTCSLAVGSQVINSTQAAITGIGQSPLAKSVELHVPSYVFNPVYEQQYLGDMVKEINYTDIYQFQIQNIASGSSVNSLISNGISDMRKIIIVPVLSKAGNGGSFDELQSPFSTCGGGTTAPLSHITNVQIQVAGQNVFTSPQKYTYQTFLQQLYGINSINGGQTVGLQSGLIDQLDFETSYGYYVANVERMLPVEKAVPKSLNIQFQNVSGKECSYLVFVEYGQKVEIDVLTASVV